MPSFPMILERVHLRSYESMSYYHHLHIMLSNEFMLIYTDKDLLHMPHSLGRSFLK